MGFCDTYKGMGPDIFRSQLWVPTGTVGSSSGGPGAEAHRRGLQLLVDLDLEKFFDRVNHDKLMGQIAKRVEDKRLRKLIRAFLNAAVMENGLVSPSVEGTPQGGPLRPC
jgi:retron-type reverse transcriptase